MRKLLVLGLLATSLMMVGCGSALQGELQDINREEVTIKPSEETEEILKLLGEDVHLVDIEFHEDVKSYKLESWVCNEGEWKLDDSIESVVESKEKKIGIKEDGDKYYLYDISEDGYKTMEIDAESIFEGVQMNKLGPASIVGNMIPNTDVELFLKASKAEEATNSSYFKNAGYESGVVFTITFLD